MDYLYHVVKKPIHITIPQNSPANELIDKALKQKDEFRKAVEQITELRSITETKPKRVKSLSNSGT